ncbi:MAG: prenyltransferase/squalene oxidase repeat-containing protein, partial [Planctomycetota bacterium]
HEQEVEKPVLVHEEAEVSDHFETDNDMDTQTARGHEDAISDIPLGGTGVTGSMGVGGGGMAGCFGYRGGGGRKRAIARFGGSKATESAVEAALRWLARHQESDGRWAGEKWGGKSKSYSLSMTGLATLAFLGAGYTHKSGKFRDNVNRAVNYIVSRQRDDGCLYEGGWACWGYSHSMAGIALVEAYGMSKDPALKEAAQKSVTYSTKVHQKPYSGWRYKAKQEGDISHTGWFIMQLKSAKVAGLQVDGAAFQGGMNFTTKLLSPKSGRSVYQIGQATPAFMNGSGGRRGQPQRRTAISMVCRLFMGTPRDDELMRKSAGWVAAAPPKWEEEDFYYWYYATLAMFQSGGEDWETWNKGLKPTLVKNQRKGGPLDGSENDVDGSWDYEGDPYGKKSCGRVYTTALGALCLEVYYRYLPMYSK